MSQEGLADPVDPPGPVARRRLTRVLLRWLMLLAVVAAFAVALGGRWRSVAQELGRLSPLALLGSGLLVLVAVPLTFRAWTAVLDDLGSPVPFAPGAKTFFVGQLGKYVPGSVWPVVVQMRLGQRMGVPRTRMALAFVVTLGMSVALGLAVGLAALPSLLSGAHPAYALLLLLLPVALVFLHPRPLNAALSLALRVTRRPPMEQPLSGRGVLRVAAWSLGFWVVAGLHVWLLCVALGAPPARTLPVALGGFALAFCVGPLLVVLPAGAGVREAVLTVLLATVLPTPSAVAVALVSRFLLAVADGVLAGAAALLDRSTSARAEVGSAPPA